MSGIADTDTKGKQDKEVKWPEAQGVDVGKGEDKTVRLSFIEDDNGILRLVDQEQVKRWPDSWLGLLS